MPSADATAWPRCSCHPPPLPHRSPRTHCGKSSSPKHLRRITRLHAPDPVIALLGGPFAAHTCYADLPPAARAIPTATSWANGELRLWWSVEWWAAEPGALRRSPSPARRAVVWTVLLVGERLDDHEELGGIPPEIWVVVLGFVRHAVLPALTTDSEE